MKKIFINISLITIMAISAYLSYTRFSGIYSLGSAFLCGTAFGLLIMSLKLNTKNDKLNSYKRELEKESIVSTESTSRIKVLESKIEVLEKALENALKQ